MGAQQELQIKIIRESGDCEGRVTNLEEPAWKVTEQPTSGERPRPVRWEVLVALPEEIESMLLLFETRAFAERWSATDERARGFDWSGLDPARDAVDLDAGLGRRYRALASRCGVPLDSEEAFDLAHRENLLRSSLVLYDGYGANTTNNVAVVQPTALTRLTWTPRSCMSEGSSYLYDQQLREIQAIHGRKFLPRCAPGARYARTT